MNVRSPKKISHPACDFGTLRERERVLLRVIPKNQQKIGKNVSRIRKKIFYLQYIFSMAQN
jgi:hypothetical protein